MSERLYRKIKFADGGKVYVPTVKGRKVFRAFGKASDAQAYSQARKERLERGRWFAAQSNRKADDGHTPPPVSAVPTPAA